MDFDPSKDYYKSLGVSESATQDEIKKAFKKLAVQHHPDKGGEKAKFQEINEANQTLGDEKKRQQYDMYRKGGWGGMGGFSGGGWGFGWFWWFGGGGWVDIDLNDVMDSFFWWGRRWGGGPRPGEDIQVGLDISFEESYNGVSKTIQYARKVKMAGVTEEKCDTCKGRGVVNQATQTVFGMMQVQNACPNCGGAGVTYKKDGKKISGWLETSNEQLEVKVPAGIKHGVHIRYTGKGDSGMGNAGDGDLYIQINVRHSDKYKRHESDLYVTVPVSIFDLVLGAELMVPHPEWEMKVKIPKGTQTNDKIRVAKKWFGDKWLFSSAGDMYIIPKLQIPKKLSHEEERLWSELRKTTESK